MNYRPIVDWIARLQVLLPQSEWVPIGQTKLSGELRYTNATGMDDLVERLFRQQSGCKQVVVDLNAASFMDSTYVGLLASLARYCQQQQLPKQSAMP